MATTRKISSVQRVAECSIMLALAVVFNQFTSIDLPFGGSITFFSQLPIIIASYRHSTKWGLATGFAMGVIQMIFGLKNFSYVTGITAYIILVLCDYIIAFAALGLGGIFKGKIKNQAAAIAMGGVVASVIRFICHFISGVTIWSGYAEETPVVIYSLSYNAGFMVPELIMTIIGAFALGSLLDFSGDVIKPLKKEKKQ